MRANAQHDGCPAEYRWCPLLECRAVMLPRRKTHWNLQKCPKLANRSQPLVGCFTTLWGHVGKTIFFPIVNTCLSCKDIAQQSCVMVPRWRFLGPAFPVSCVQHISDLHSKSALQPHHFLLLRLWVCVCVRTQRKRIFCLYGTVTVSDSLNGCWKHICLVIATTALCDTC